MISFEVFLVLLLLSIILVASFCEPSLVCVDCLSICYYLCGGINARSKVSLTVPVAIHSWCWEDEAGVMVTDAGPELTQMKVW